MIYIFVIAALCAALLFAVYYYDQYQLRQLLRESEEAEAARREALLRTAGHTPLVAEKPRLHFANLPPAKPRAEAPQYPRGYPVAPKTTQQNRTPAAQTTAAPAPDDHTLPLITALMLTDTTPAQAAPIHATPVHHAPAEACNAHSFSSDSNSSYSCDSSSSYSDSSSSSWGGGFE